jgi:hypothetical protein
MTFAPAWPITLSMGAVGGLLLAYSGLYGRLTRLRNAADAAFDALTSARAAGGDTAAAQAAYDAAAARYDAAVQHGPTRFIASWARMTTHGQRVAAGAVPRRAD